MSWRTVSSSAVSARPGNATPRALERSKIRGLIESWRGAALDYLIQQFLSLLANQRSDAYGGDLNGCLRQCLKIIEAVRAAMPTENLLFLRVLEVDGTNSRWSMDDTVARAAKKLGVVNYHELLPLRYSW